MRKLHIASKSPSEKLSQELETLTEKAKLQQLPYEAQEALLLRIRNGDATAIPLLVDSWEIIVLSMVRQYLLNEEVQVAELVSAGKEALTRLAENELNSTGREYFFELGTRNIRSAIWAMLKRRKEENL